MGAGITEKGLFKDKAIQAGLDKCLSSNQEHVYLCLLDCNTNQDKIEISPGIQADVLVHGQDGGYGRQPLPTIVVLKCSDIKKERCQNAIPR